MIITIILVTRDTKLPDPFCPVDAQASNNYLLQDFTAAAIRNAYFQIITVKLKLK